MLVRKASIVQVNFKFSFSTELSSFSVIFLFVDCKLNIHRPCSKILEENCPGPLPQVKRKDKDLNNDSKISKLIMGKIRPKTSTDASGGT